MSTIRQQLSHLYESNKEIIDEEVLDISESLYKEYKFATVTSFVDNILDFKLTTAYKALSSNLFDSYVKHMSSSTQTKQPGPVDLGSMSKFDVFDFDSLDFMHIPVPASIEPQTVVSTTKEENVPSASPPGKRRFDYHDTPTQFNAPLTPYSARLGSPANYHTRKHKDSGMVVSCISSIVEKTGDMFDEEKKVVLEMSDIVDLLVPPVVKESEMKKSDIGEQLMDELEFKTESKPAVMTTSGIMPVAPEFRYLNWNLDATLQERDSKTMLIVDKIVASDAFQKVFGEEKIVFRNPEFTSLASCFYAGRVTRIDPQSKFSVNNLALESILIRHKQPEIVDMRLGDADLKSYSLYPGQVVVIRGTKPNDTICPSHIFTETACQVAQHIVEQQGLKVVFAAGPYERASQLGDGALGILLDVLIEKNVTYPDVLILTGPFVDAEHNAIKTCTMNGQSTDIKEEGLIDIYKNTGTKLSASFTDIRKDVLLRIKERLEEVNASTKVIIMPSLNDVSHIKSTPQPPFTDNPDPTRFFFVGNPTLLNIRGVKIGAISMDVITKILTEEVGAPNRLLKRYSQTFSHIVAQQTFFSPSSIPVDYTLPTPAPSIYFPETPDIVIVPSIFQQSVERIPIPGSHSSANDTLASTDLAKTFIAINSSTSMKGETPGFYVSIHVQPGSGTVSSRTSVDIVRL